MFRVAVLPLPETLPLLAVQPLTVTGTLSGLVQVQVMVELPPACNDASGAEACSWGESRASAVRHQARRERPRP